MTQLSILKQRLLDAESALHRLMVGELEVTISVGGYGATTYAQTDKPSLETYIAQLKRDIAALQGRGRRGPVYLRF